MILSTGSIEHALSMCILRSLWFRLVTNLLQPAIDNFLFCRRTTSFLLQIATRLADLAYWRKLLIFTLKWCRSINTLTHCVCIKITFDGQTFKIYNFLLFLGENLAKSVLTYVTHFYFKMFQKNRHIVPLLNCNC